MSIQDAQNAIIVAVCDHKLKTWSQTEFSMILFKVTEAQRKTRRDTREREHRAYQANDADDAHPQARVTPSYVQFVLE
jgi:hypothetical protein